MKDFIGNEITPGCYIAKGGKGNGPGEYGMIAYKVGEVKNNKIFAKRLSIRYPSPGVVTLVKTTISNPNSVLIFQPPPKVLKLFIDADAGTLLVEDRLLVGKWLHGPELTRPWGE